MNNLKAKLDTIKRSKLFPDELIPVYEKDYLELQKRVQGDSYTIDKALDKIKTKYPDTIFYI